MTRCPDRRSWQNPDQILEQTGLGKSMTFGEGLKNVLASVGAGEETVFCDSCADYVFLGIVLHDFNDPNRVLQNARRMLKPTGKLVNLDWKKIHMRFGPPYEIRFNEDKAVALIRKNSFTVEEVRESGKYHYLVIAHPS